MSKLIYLKIEKDTYKKFQNIHQQLIANSEESVSHDLGDVLAQISFEVIEQVFGEISRSSSHPDQESEKTLQQINDNLQKYMPWSISLFGNERLIPLVEYLEKQIFETPNHHFLTFPISNDLYTSSLNSLEQICMNNHEFIAPAFKSITQIVDDGVTHLIREPKKLLNFNFIVDKTLSGVISLTTQLGYKRIEKLADQLDISRSQRAMEHFLSFAREPKQEF
jgi:hypothetical protein